MVASKHYKAPCSIVRNLLLVFLFFITGCAELQQAAKEINKERPLTRNEVVQALKQALVVGSDSAASRLSVKDGYYRDRSVKINLPPDAEMVTKHASKIPGGEKLIEDVILRINRSAEDAAREAAPVFAKAVANLSIRDGFEILRGENDAATNYLKGQTYSKLYKLYQPKIKASLDKEIIGNITTNESWETLTKQWNRAASSLVGKMADLETIETDLDKYLTEQALDGLFLKLAIQEEKIRNNPQARVTELLERVFGKS